VPALIDLHAAVAAEGRWIATEPGFDREARAAMVTESLATGTSGGDPCAGFVVDGRPGDAGGAIAGNLNVFARAYGVTELGMMVAAGRRGEGIGSALLQAAIDWSRAQGAHKISLEMWPDNDAARGLYEKFGFVDEGFLRDHYRRSDGSLRSAVVMGLLLDREAPLGDDGR